METRRMRVALIYGGRSAELEVSLASARTVAAALDPGKYELAPVAIDSEGRWTPRHPCELLPAARRGKTFVDAISPAPLGAGLPAIAQAAALGGVDLVFPVLHGPCGEDGSVQGLARLAGLPCVGADVLGSALCMDKDAAKRILRDSGIAVAPFRTFSSPSEARAAWPELAEELGGELFVKPANLGSSVGVSRSRCRAEYEAAVALAFAYDLKIVVEKRIEGREIEVGVLGNRELRASAPGEVAVRGDYYDYGAKYLDEEGAELRIPAPLGEAEAEACRALALEACRALCVWGMARVDLFLPPGGAPIVNEVNTIPGFTSRSMFPLLWEASGLPLPALVDELVELALEAAEERSALRSAPPAGLGDGVSAGRGVE
jgi:D-alanine-D-alanine ligase